MKLILTVATIAGVALGAAPARAQMGPGLDLSWNSLDGGGGTSTGGGFTLIGTIGQPDAGAATGGVLALAGGFLGGGGGPPACYPDCNGSGTLSVADFGCFQGKYVLGDLYADCNGSGALSVADFGCFQGKYVLGCP
ncbi:MAG: hypothetical protein ACKVU4_11295 [Phycisphaerales bacterium]